jgi:oligoendopeptidase F
LSQVVVLALYGTYKRQGADFAPGYLDLLRSGGNGTPEELLGKAGVDLRDHQVLRRAYEELERVLAALREEVES